MGKVSASHEPTGQADRMQNAPFDVVIGAELATRIAHDARADGGRRMIMLDPRWVRIKRRVQGMKMHLSVPIKNYLGVAVGCDELSDGALYRVTLVHRDPELCVVLKETRDQSATFEACRFWAAYFAMPAFVALDSNAAQPADSNTAREPSIPLPAATSRRLSIAPRRRSRLRLRRARCEKSRDRRVIRGEREIICYE